MKYSFFYFYKRILVVVFLISILHFSSIFNFTNTANGEFLYMYAKLKKILKSCLFFYSFYTIICIYWKMFSMGGYLHQTKQHFLSRVKKV